MDGSHLDQAFELAGALQDPEASNQTNVKILEMGDYWTTKQSEDDYLTLAFKRKFLN
jgi:hypothetical protein